MDFPIDKLIWARIQLDDKQKAMAKGMKSTVEDIKTQLGQLDGKIMELLNQQGSNSIRTDSGTAFKDNKDSFTVGDRDAFIEWVRENDAWDFLPAKINPASANAYMEENDGALPPGIKFNRFVVVKFRRPTTKPQ